MQCDPLPLRVRAWLHDIRAVMTRPRIVAAVGFFAMLYAGASAIAALGDDASARPSSLGAPVQVTLALPDLRSQPSAMRPESDEFTVMQHVRGGESLGSLFERIGLDDAAAEAFVRTDPLARRLTQLRPGQAVQARLDDTGALMHLEFAELVPDEMPSGAPATREVVVERDGNAFRAVERTIEDERRVEMRAGDIHGSLFGATDDAGIPDAVTQQIVDIFDAQIDFHKDLRRGDTFRVIYETFWLHGEFVRAGRVLAVEFVNDGQMHSAAWFEPQPGHGSYYDLEGHSVRRAFLRTPLAFSRVTSGFSNARLNPVSQQWKAHRGVDYAAPTGTTIRSVGDGVVSFAGWQNGYGNVVIVKHAGPYETLYAHMSGIAHEMRRGARVQQGQTIGFVGMTGWATGPHLHFEFHVDGAPQNPLAIALPEAAPVPATSREAFAARADDLKHRLALLDVTRLARAE